MRGARLLAAEALGEVERLAAVPLLRFKLAIGDADPEVVGACAGALLAVDAPLGLEVAAGLLGGASGANAESVAVALGESKKPAAFAVLRAHAEQVDTAGRASAYLAIALLRDSAATGLRRTPPPPCTRSLTIGTILGFGNLHSRPRPGARTP